MLRARLGDKPFRDYGMMISRLAAGPDRDITMRSAVDILWDALGGRGVSWIGFYRKVADRDEMVLEACRDKPACSPLGLQGMCGRCWKERRPILLHDAAALPPDGYIACDPLDRSEVVIPLFEPDGKCWGVLDADSHEVGTFLDTDVAGLTRAVERLGLSTPQVPPPPVLRL